MQIISIYEVDDNGTRYTRSADAERLTITKRTGESDTLTGEEARLTWVGVLQLGCLAAGLREDASIFEIRAWLDRNRL